MMKAKLFKVFSVLLVLTLLFPFSVSADPPEPPEITVLDDEPAVTAAVAQQKLDLDSTRRAIDGRVHLIVELTAPPLGLSNLTRRAEFDVESAASQAYLSAVRQQQQEVIGDLSLSAPSAEVDFRYAAAFNGLAVRIYPDEAAALLQMEAVKRVYPDRMRTALLDSSTAVINAPALWNDLGGQEHAGEGIRIAVIDTGIRSENPMFAGDGYIQPPGFPHGYCADFPADPDFQCNDKLIAARYYTPTFEIHFNEVRSPLDVHGHGSHVAGIAAGNPVDVPVGAVVPVTTTISGVAPNAYLLVYKALFAKPDGNAGGSDAMLLAALDDALLDGADVISNSWGSDDGGNPADSPYQTAIAALHATGAVVVFAAGNGGSAPGTISCPGCLEDVITVGASTANRIFANTLDATGPDPVPVDLVGLAALNGTGPEITDDIEAQILYSGAVDPGNVAGCTSFGSAVFSSAIALLPRGGCDFQTKVENAQAAGASAVAVFNTEPGFPLRMAGLESTLIPAVFLSQDGGEALRDWVSSTPAAVARINARQMAIYNNFWQDYMWESSAAGPNGNPNVLKPDLIAPGVNILSAASPSFTGGHDFQFLRGSSTATPHVAGAAALVIQQHPDWTPVQIKSALTNSAEQKITQADGITAATPFEMGVGRLDLGYVSDVGVTLDPVSFANDNCMLQCAWQGVIKNESLLQAWWEVAVDAPAGMSVQVDPSFAILELGESRTFTVTVDVSGLPADEWQFATVHWEHKFDAYADAHLPLAMYVVEPDLANLEKVADRVVAEPGDTASYTLTLVSDSPLTTSFLIRDPIPTNATYVPGSATGGLVYDAVDDELFATIELDAVQMQLIPDTLHGYIPLSDYVDPQPCPDVACDDAAMALTGLDFYYNGRPVGDVVWSTNGFLQVGSEIPDLTTPNQNLPNPVSPNNLIAPLWTDLDLDGGDGVGSGTWYWGFFQYGTDDYYIFEWEEAALKSNPARRYSFQVWIKTGTDEIWFVYGPQTVPVTTGTVGVENQYGMAGYTHFYNGSGTAPIDGTSLKVLTEVDQAVFTYALELGPTLGVGVTNIATATDTVTNRTIQDSVTIWLGDRQFLPFVVR
jgi:minor extracellular serine protease Vpr